MRIFCLLSSLFISGCLATISPKNVSSNDSERCQLVQRDLTKPIDKNAYWCKHSYFIERVAMKSVLVDSKGQLRADIVEEQE